MASMAAMSRAFASYTVALAILLAVASTASAQCPGRWLPRDAIPNSNGFVYALTMWDPDGPGPIPARLVVAGAFSNIGILPILPANHVAAFDPATGQSSALATGTN